ncbi:MAG: hypothetical protein NTX64_15635 [Elusimicrobia bacterium]|nr:hypothetical protein [Elusimicrobiota bacterium]
MSSGYQYNLLVRGCDNTGLTDPTVACDASGRGSNYPTSTLNGVASSTFSIASPMPTVASTQPASNLANYSGGAPAGWTGNAGLDTADGEPLVLRPFPVFSGQALDPFGIAPNVTQIQLQSGGGCWDGAANLNASCGPGSTGGTWITVGGSGQGTPTFSWSYPANAAVMANGAYTLFAKTKDVAGNPSVYASTGTMMNRSDGQVGLPFVISNSSPTIAMAGVGLPAVSLPYNSSSTWRSQLASIQGTATEGGNLSDVVYGVHIRVQRSRDGSWLDVNGNWQSAASGGWTNYLLAYDNRNLGTGNCGALSQNTSFFKCGPANTVGWTYGGAVFADPSGPPSAGQGSNWISSKLQSGQAFDPRDISGSSFTLFVTAFDNARTSSGTSLPLESFWTLSTSQTTFYYDILPPTATISVPVNGVGTMPIGQLQFTGAVADACGQYTSCAGFYASTAPQAGVNRVEYLLTRSDGQYWTGSQWTTLPGGGAAGNWVPANYAGASPGLTTGATYWYFPSPTFTNSDVSSGYQYNLLVRGCDNTGLTDPAVACDASGRGSNYPTSALNGVASSTFTVSNTPPTVASTQPASNLANYSGGAPAGWTGNAGLDTANGEPLVLRPFPVFSGQALGVFNISTNVTQIQLQSSGGCWDGAANLGASCGPSSTGGTWITVGGSGQGTPTFSWSYPANATVMANGAYTLFAKSRDVGGNPTTYASTTTMMNRSDGQAGVPFVISNSSPTIAMAGVGLPAASLPYSSSSTWRSQLNSVQGTAAEGGNLSDVVYGVHIRVQRSRDGSWLDVNGNWQPAASGGWTNYLLAYDNRNLGTGSCGANSHNTSFFKCGPANTVGWMYNGGAFADPSGPPSAGQGSNWVSSKLQSGQAFDPRDISGSSFTLFVTAFDNARTSSGTSLPLENFWYLSASQTTFYYDILPPTATITVPINGAGSVPTGQMVFYGAVADACGQYTSCAGFYASTAPQAGVNRVEYLLTRSDGQYWTGSQWTTLPGGGSAGNWVPVNYAGASPGLTSGATYWYFMSPTFANSDVTNGYQYNLLVRGCDNTGLTDPTVACDSAGRGSNYPTSTLNGVASSTFTINNAAPAVTMTFPLAGNYVNSVTSFTGTAAGANSAALRAIQFALWESTTNRYWNASANQWTAAGSNLVVLTTVTIASPWSYTTFNSANLVSGVNYMVAPWAVDVASNATNALTPLAASAIPFIYDVTAPVSSVTSVANNAYLNTLSTPGVSAIFSGVATDTGSNNNGAFNLSMPAVAALFVKQMSDGTFWDPTQNKFYVFPSSGNTSLLWSTATAGLTDSMHLTWSFSSSLLASKLTGGTTYQVVARTRDAAGNFTGQASASDLVAAGAPPLTFYWDVTPPTMTILNPPSFASPSQWPQLGPGTSVFYLSVGDQCTTGVCGGVSRVEYLLCRGGSYWNGGSWGTLPSSWPGAPLTSGTSIYSFTSPAFTALDDQTTFYLMARACDKLGDASDLAIMDCASASKMTNLSLVYGSSFTINASAPVSMSTWPISNYVNYVTSFSGVAWAQNPLPSNPIISTNVFFYVFDSSDSTTPRYWNFQTNAWVPNTVFLATPTATTLYASSVSWTWSYSTQFSTNLANGHPYQVGVWAKDYLGNQGYGTPSTFTYDIGWATTTFSSPTASGNNLYLTPPPPGVPLFIGISIDNLALNPADPNVNDLMILQWTNGATYYWNSSLGKFDNAIGSANASVAWLPATTNVALTYSTMTWWSFAPSAALANDPNPNTGVANAWPNGLQNGTTYQIVIRARDRVGNYTMQRSTSDAYAAGLSTSANVAPLFTFNWDVIAPTLTIRNPYVSNGTGPQYQPTWNQLGAGASTFIILASDNCNNLPFHYCAGVNHVEYQLYRAGDQSYWDGAGSWVQNSTWPAATLVSSSTVIAMSTYSVTTPAFTGLDNQTTFYLLVRGCDATGDAFNQAKSCGDPAKMTNISSSTLYYSSTFTVVSAAPLSISTWPGSFPLSSYVNYVSSLSGTAWAWNQTSSNPLVSFQFSLFESTSSRYWNTTKWSNSPGTVIQLSTPTVAGAWSYNTFYSTYLINGLNYTVATWAQDFLGNQGYATPTSFTYDIGWPTASVTSQGSGVYMSAMGTSNIFIGTATDNAQFNIAMSTVVAITIKRLSDNYVWSSTKSAFIQGAVTASTSAFWSTTTIISQPDGTDVTWGFSSGLLASRLTNGTTYQLVARARDAAGNYTGQSSTSDLNAIGYLLGPTTFYWDTSPPTITIVFPANGTQLGAGASTSTFKLTVTDPLPQAGYAVAGVNKVEYLVYSQTRGAYWNPGLGQWGEMLTPWPTAASAGGNSYTLNSPNFSSLDDQTTFWLMVRACDATGNAANQALACDDPGKATNISLVTSSTFTLNVSTPLASVTRPANGAFMNYLSSFTGTATVFESASLAGVQLRLADSIGTYWSTATCPVNCWSATPVNSTVTAAASWTYVYYSTNNKGNAAACANSQCASPAVTFTYDTTPPAATVQAPQNGVFLKSLPPPGQSSLISGAAQDTLPGSINSSALDMGAVAIYIHVDKPTGAFWSTTTNHFENLYSTGGANGNFSLSWATASYTAISPYAWTFNSSYLLSQLNALPSGTSIQIVARARDLANNYTGQTSTSDAAAAGGPLVLFTWDTDLPTTTIRWPKPSASPYPTLGLGTSVFSLVAADPTSGINRLEYLIQRSSDGYFWDGAGNWQSAMPSPWPTATLVSSGTAMNPHSSTFSLTSPPFANADNTHSFVLMARACDLTGDVTSPDCSYPAKQTNVSPVASSSFTILTGLPLSSISNIANNSIVNTVATLTGSAAASYGGTISTVAVQILDDTTAGSYKYWDGANLQWVSDATFTAVGNLTWSYTLPTTPPPLTDGHHYTATPWASDTLGNQSIGGPIGFWYSVSWPTATVTTPANSTYTAVSAIPAISGTASPIGTLSYTELYIKQGVGAGAGSYWDPNNVTGLGANQFNAAGSPLWFQWTTGNSPNLGSWSYNSSGVAWNGAQTYTIGVRVTDVAGNKTNQASPASAGNAAGFTANVNFDVVKPTAVIVTPANGSFFSNISNITGTADDTGPSSVNPGHIRGVYLNFAITGTTFTYNWNSQNYDLGDTSTTADPATQPSYWQLVFKRHLECEHPGRRDDGHLGQGAPFGGGRQGLGGPEPDHQELGDVHLHPAQLSDVLRAARRQDPIPAAADGMPAGQQQHPQHALDDHSPRRRQRQRHRLARRRGELRDGDGAAVPLERDHQLLDRHAVPKRERAALSLGLAGGHSGHRRLDDLDDMELPSAGLRQNVHRRRGQHHVRHPDEGPGRRQQRLGDRPLDRGFRLRHVLPHRHDHLAAQRRLYESGGPDTGHGGGHRLGASRAGAGPRHP